MVTTTRSTEYQVALVAMRATEDHFFETSIAEMQRLIPEHVATLVLRVNDTPRLTLDAIIDVNGDEWDATDPGSLQPDVYDAIDEVAMQLGIRDTETADNWFVNYPNEWERFVLEREVAA